jgi:nucleoside-diphosphate-sugar epimerase
VRALVLGVNGVAGRAIASSLADAGWSVTGSGQEASRFPDDLRAAGVTFARSDRYESLELNQVIGTGADLIVDCLCYTAAHARQLLAYRADVGSVIMLSSRAVYVDDQGRHVNSAEPPRFSGPVSENNPVVAADESGNYNSADGYAANKVAAEQTLLESGWPASVLRLGLLHGIGGKAPREWFVVRRLLDGRRRIPLAHLGTTADHPAAADNLARLVLACAIRPATRVLNAADPDTPTAADVVTAIAAACGQSVEVAGLSPDADDDLGWSPWSSWPPFLLDTSAAEVLGYTPAGSYAETVHPTAQWLFTIDRAKRAQLDAASYLEGRFDYALDDAGLALAHY